MYAFHRDRGAAATIASYPREVRIDFGVLEFGDDPHVLTGYREKPEFSFQVSMGVYILDPVAWDFLTPGQPLPMPDLLETMRGAGQPVHCFRQPCYWLDIGRHDDYATANEIFEARRAAFLGEPERRGSRLHRSGTRPMSDRPSLTLSGARRRPRLPDRVDPVRLPDRHGGPAGSTSARSARATSARRTSAGSWGSGSSWSSSCSTCSRGSCRPTASRGWSPARPGAALPDLPVLRGAGDDPRAQLPGLPRSSRGARGSRRASGPSSRSTPVASVAAAAGFVVFLLVTRYVSLSSIAGRPGLRCSSTSPGSTHPWAREQIAMSVADDRPAGPAGRPAPQEPRPDRARGPSRRSPSARRRTRPARGPGRAGPGRRAWPSSAGAAALALNAAEASEADRRAVPRWPRSPGSRPATSGPSGWRSPTAAGSSP